uniref:Class II aldolase/adducin N-terminal domain-containing protein n=1 Tax=Globodera rostochiensis TaxID=31243 RepID=A0A914GXT1_GLORO
MQFVSPVTDANGVEIVKANGRSDFCSDFISEGFVREKQRPAAIKEDLWEMGRRRRVHQVLGARDFCSELEQVIRHDVAASSSVPEQLDIATQLQKQQQQWPPSVVFSHRLPQLPLLNVNQVINTPPIRIADLPEFPSFHNNRKYTFVETTFRNKLATLYRLVDLFHWSQGIYNHITLRLSGANPPEFLINPFGLLYHEITASSLIKLNLKGKVLDQGSTHLGVNQAAYVLHSAIHEARPDVHCVLHLHTAVVAAVGSMKCGLLPLCQEAMIIGPVAYHDYQGILTDEEEKQSIVRDLGDKNVLILRNHGFVACGQSVEDALHLAFHTVIACETQIRAARVGLDNLIVPSGEAALKAYKTARNGGGGVNRFENVVDGLSDGVNGCNGKVPTRTAHSWGIGELEWEAWCRVLDSAGYHTGHLQKQPPPLRHWRVRHDGPRHHSMYNLSSVATPPNGPTSVGEAREEELTLAGGITSSYRLTALRSRAKWLNSPNHYQKVQLMETGTDHPRIITKWQQCNDPNVSSFGSTPVKIHSPHQFSPCGPSTDPREFRERQRRMKEVRLSSTVSPGPRSQVLVDGATLAKAADAREGALYIGTASKGIIDRGHQHNAQVYRRLYAPNPFSEMDGDLNRYLDELELTTTAAVQKSKSSPEIAEVCGRVVGDGGRSRSTSPSSKQQSHRPMVTEAMNGHGRRSASEEPLGRNVNGTMVGNGKNGDERNGGDRTLNTDKTAGDANNEQQQGKKTKKGGGRFFASFIRRKRK